MVIQLSHTSAAVTALLPLTTAPAAAGARRMQQPLASELTAQQGVPYVQKQVELDRFGQSRLSGRSLLLYNYEDNGGLWENLRFSPLSLLGEDETSVSFVLRTHSTMFHLLHRTTSKSKGVKIKDD